MYQNNKKPELSSNRWSFIVNFLHQNYPRIQSLLREAIFNDALRVYVLIDKITEGEPILSVQPALPEQRDKILICSIPAGSIAIELLDNMIQDITVVDMVLMVSRQVDVKL